jgi:predicted RNA-binding Zn ribbon-like protein
MRPPPTVSRAAPSAPRAPRFALVGGRLWLDFVNTDDVPRPATADPPTAGARERTDALIDFDHYVDWLVAAGQLDAERAAGIRRRAQQQPAGATAALVDARRVRAALRQLAERGSQPRVRADALAEINRVLGRSAGTRRVEAREDGSFARTFVSTGDAFAALVIPVVESAADALVAGELPRVRRCADAHCGRVFLDATRNHARRWCDMASCGNRAKSRRWRSARP